MTKTYAHVQLIVCGVLKVQQTQLFLLFKTQLQQFLLVISTLILKQWWKFVKTC